MASKRGEDIIEKALDETRFSKNQQLIRKKAFGYSSLSVLLLLLFLYLLKIPNLNPPFDNLEALGGGGEVILGNDLEGMGETFDGVKAGTPQAVESEANPSPPQSTETVTEPIDEAETPEEATEEKKKVDKTPIKPVDKPIEKVHLEKPKETPKTELKKIETPKIETKNEPVKEVNKKTLFGPSGNNGTGGSNTSKGDGNTPGDKGAKDGNKNGTSFTGGSTTGSTTGSTSGVGVGSGPGKGFAIEGNLKGRKVTLPPVIRKESDQEGIIKVTISVNRGGDVIEARAGARGTTIVNQSLIDYVENSVKKMKFDDVQEGPEIQTGVISFSFKLE